jgi:hypothetical protein
MSTQRKELYRLIEALPEKEIPVAKRFLEFIINEASIEDIKWLNADLADWPPYDWGPEGPPKGKAGS